MATVIKFPRILKGTCCRFSQISGWQSLRYNCNRASITRMKREHYVRTYPVLLLQPDGSTITIRYEKPRKLLKLPVDVSSLTEEEKKERIKIFRPPKKMEVREEVEDDFDVNQYANLFKKKKWFREICSLGLLWSIT